MPDTRQVARELALKALFQADVGHHPVEETVEGALETLRHSVDQVTDQLVERAKTAVFDVVEAYVEEHGRYDVRRMRGAGRTVMLEIEQLGREANELTRSAVGRVREYTGLKVARVFWERAREARARIHRLPDRLPVPPELAKQVTATACEHASGFILPYFKRVRPAAQSAVLLVLLVEGITRNEELVNRAVRRLAEDWDFERHPAVDRNILRIGAFETMFADDTDRPKSIDEALRLAEKYSTEEAVAYINGVLGTVAKRYRRMDDPEAAKVDYRPMSVIAQDQEEMEIGSNDS